MRLHGVSTLVLWNFVCVIIIIIVIIIINHFYVNVTLEFLRCTWHRRAKHFLKFTLYSFQCVR